MTILIGFIVVLTLGTSVEMKHFVPGWLCAAAYVAGSAGLSWLATAVSMSSLRDPSAEAKSPGSTSLIAGGPAAPTAATCLPARLVRWQRLLGLAPQLWMAGGLGVALWAGYGRWVWNDLGLAPDLPASAGSCRLPLLWFLAGVAPLLAAAAMYWLLEYPLQREVRARNIRGSTSLTACRPWTRRDFFLFSLRQDVVMVGVPLALILTLHDCLQLYLEPRLPPAWSEGAVLLAMPAGALAILCLAPWLIVRAWGTRRLPEGLLRDALMDVRKRTGVSFGEMLIWPTGMNVVNAAVLGIVRPFRYALLTDALVEYLSPREVEAVFHHEVRHVQAHHLFYLMLFVLSAGMLCGGAAVGAGWLADRASGGAVRLDDAAQEVLSLVLMVAAVAWPFGWVSRRFERQCDTFAAWQMSSPRDPSGSSPRDPSGGTGNLGVGTGVSDPDLPAVVGPQSPRSPVSGPECSHRVTGIGAATFCWALQRLVLINCSSLQRRNWRHGAVAWRVEYLMKLSATGGSVRQIDGVVRRIKLGIWAATAASVALIVVGIVR